MSLVLTTAKPPVSSESTRRLSWPRRASFVQRRRCRGRASDRRETTESRCRSSDAGAEAADVDAVDRHVGARRRGNRVARRVDDRGGVAVVERIGDVVVDAFAEVDQRLAAAAHAFHDLGEVLQRVERVARLEAALGRVGIVDPLAGGAHAARHLLLVETVRAAPSGACGPMNLSMALSSRRGLLVNSCAASVRPLVCTTAATSLAPM